MRRLAVLLILLSVTSGAFAKDFDGHWLLKQWQTYSRSVALWNAGESQFGEATAGIFVGFTIGTALMWEQFHYVKPHRAELLTDVGKFLERHPDLLDEKACTLVLWAILSQPEKKQIKPL